MIAFQKQTRDKIEVKRSEKLFEEQRECFFHPQISKKSEKIINEKVMGGDASGRSPFIDNQNLMKNGIDKFSMLYEDAKRRKERQDKIYSNCMESECTF